MASLMEDLLSLQSLDRGILEIRAALRAVPEREKQVEAMLAIQSASIVAAKAKAVMATEARKEKEALSEALRARISKIKAAQAEAKSNDEYRALGRELANLDSQALEADDAILAAMEAEEAAQAACRECADALEKEKAHAAEELKRMKDTLAPKTALLEAQKEERAVLARTVPADALARYERIAGKYPGTAVAVVEPKTGTCGGCHMKLTPSDQVEARKLDTLSACGYCGRLLYAAR